MSKRLALLLVLASSAAVAAPESYTIDPYHTFPNFTVDHQGIATLHGRFDKSSGKIMLDKAGKSASVDLVIEAASITTGDHDRGSRPRTRDEHLRSADFFNVAEFPRITFKSTNVAFAGDNPSKFEGNLTLLGVTKPVTLDVVRFKCNPPAGAGKERCGGNATGSIKRSDFGMKYAIPGIQDEIKLDIMVEALKD
ncbi:MAG: polyisoprenoid-binding protein [Burkholderiales bacterium]|nr:polyisoprenoid-binding protein [Burkholderiales bacterium]